ncbi:alginate lyase family protein [Lacrimispora sp.]|uniref:alginate lyase family protein n=1 Tax=Lacrimispora sp. TaxID=2719234 RepID=UPI0028AE790C|nr:alginate lyase family protein [Lacrimispora sp.]
MTETYPAIKDILPEGMSIPTLLSHLRSRVLEANQQLTALERGQLVREQFPELAADTLRLADEALAGKLVLPGTGPALYYIGNPPKWTVNPAGDNEYTFHLNRMHHWKTMCEAYSLTGDLPYAEKVIQEITDWIDSVPCPALMDETGADAPGRFDGLTPWRALEVGIRGYRTWPYVVELLIDTPYMTEAFLEKLLPCIYVHCRILYEISPLLWPKADHNHYLMENLGLLSFSCLFPEIKNSEVFRIHALRELDRCMDAQCTPCGGQIEGCPSYHNGCVFWFSMRNVFSRKYHMEESESYTRRLNSMFLHSIHATRACGGNFPWGDSHTADKETMCLAAVSCYMASGDRNYLAVAAHFYPIASILSDIRDNLWRIPEIGRLKEDLTWAEKHPQCPELPLLAWQRDLNQVYLRTSWEKDALSLMTACRTPVQNQHAHMDPGGFDFTAYGLPLISDPGIYTYKSDENRYHFKRTASHNCLTVNGADAWEYQGSWAYGPQKNGIICAVEQTEGVTFITSCHENYAPAIATRHLALVDNRFLVIIDHVTGLSQTDIVQIHYHLNRTELIHSGMRSLISLDDGPAIELAVGNDPADLVIEDGKISTINDVWHDSKLVCFHITPDENGECWFAALAVPYPQSPGKQTASVRKLTADGRLVLECQADNRTFRLILEENQLIREKR